MDKKDLVMCDHCDEFISRSAYKRHMKKRKAEQWRNIKDVNATEHDSDSSTSELYRHGNFLFNTLMKNILY